MQSGVQKKESYTMLAGSNMLEMLTFHINQKEFGINVFKVRIKYDKCFYHLYTFDFSYNYTKQ